MTKRAAALLLIPALTVFAVVSACATRHRPPSPSMAGPLVGSGLDPAGGDAPSAMAARRTGTAAASIEPWKNGDRTGEKISTGNYEIKTTLRNGDLRRFLPQFAEAALVQYRTALGELPPPKSRLETYIFGSRDEWRANTRERLGDEAEQYMSLGRGGYTSRATAILYDIGPNDTLTILAHEGWHQYTQSTFEDELPVWLEEGIAAYMEGYRIAPDTGQPIFSAWRNLERFGEMRDADRRGRLIPLGELLQKSPQEFLAEGRERLLVYYAQVWALIHFLNVGLDEAHRDGLRALLRDAVDGRIGQRVIAHARSDSDRSAIRRALSRGGVRAIPGPVLATAYFGSDIAALSERYDAFLKQITARGAGEAIWRGTSPIKPAP